MLLMKYQHQTAAVLWVVGSVDGGVTYGFELGKENKFIIGFTTYFKGVFGCIALFEDMPCL